MARKGCRLEAESQARSLVCSEPQSVVYMVQSARSRCRRSAVAASTSPEKCPSCQGQSRSLPFISHC